jgi:hypothetical protein
MKHLFLACVGTGLKPTALTIAPGVTAPRDILRHLRLAEYCVLARGVDPPTFFQDMEDVYARVNNLDRLSVFRMNQDIYKYGRQSIAKLHRTGAP